MPKDGRLGPGRGGTKRRGDNLRAGRQPGAGERRFGHAPCVRSAERRCENGRDRDGYQPPGGRPSSASSVVTASAAARPEPRIASRKDEREVVFVSLLGGDPGAQMAVALLGRRAGARASVHSAGSRAGAEIDPNVQSAMVEIGVGLSEECEPAKSSSEGVQLSSRCAILHRVSPTEHHV